MPVADVSLLAANYNNGLYLEAFIESILASDFIPSEIIIVDDGSTDNSRQVLKKYESHPQACFIYLPQNLGFAHALNKGLAAAKSYCIMRADPDDLLHPQKIGKQLEFLRQHPDLAGAGCNVAYFHDKTNSILNYSNFPAGKEAVRRAYLKGQHGMQHPTVMIKAEVFKQFTYTQEAVPAEDYDIFARMVAAGFEFSNTPEVLFRMRIHPGSTSSRLNYSTVQKTFQCRKEIFGKKTPVLWQRLYYWHIRSYRNYLLSENVMGKILFLALAVICYPSRLIKRLAFL